jgi:endoglucanase
VVDDCPAVRVNQVGYPRWAVKQATLVSDADDPVEFALVTATGEVVWRGRSRPWGERPEPTSGLPVHVLDFSDAGVEGDGLRVRVGGATSHPFRIGDDVYAGLARDALHVFYLLRSGCEITEARAPGYARPAGHPGDVAVPAWQGPDADLLYPGWRDTGTFDVSGGWYDAGDYGKYVTSGSIALWQLLHALDAHRRPDRHRELLVEECRWQLDWLLRMQVPPGRQYAGMAFHRVHGTRWSPMPGLPHEDPTRRVLHRPSTVATLHLAAVAAQGARVLGPADASYAARLLAAARTAYAAARDRPLLVAPDDEGRFGGGPYGDDEPADDRYWAAVQLWLATGEPEFLADLTRSDQHTADVFDPAGFDFDRVGAPAMLDLALVAGTDLPDRDRVRAGVVAAADRLRALQAAQPWGQPYAPPAGWDWGSNGRILNNLVVLVAAHTLTGQTRFRDGIAHGMDHLLGRNALDRSYVTGYGTHRVRHLRTRQFGHDLDPRLPPPPPGAVAGGPNSREYAGFPTDPRLRGLPPQRCHLDEPTSETTNDICIRWNAPLVHVADHLEHLEYPAVPETASSR